jgi:hypothetical protein
MSRVLKLFPKHVIRDYFEGKKTKKGVLIQEIVPSVQDSNIFKFSYENFDFTKQHVYLLTHDIKKLDDLPKNILAGNVQRNAGKDAVEYYGLYSVVYKVFLQDPYESVDLVFQCPLRLILNKGILAIHFTILEKNVQSYFTDRKVLTTRKSIEEKDIIALITNDVGKYGTLAICDLNRGIKELWRRDYIDALEVQYLKSKSTSKETMNEEYTFKQVYPKLYEDAILTPLVKVLFKFTTDQDKYCSHFVVEPTLGQLTFPISPKEKEHNQNVIRKILEFN